MSPCCSLSSENFTSSYSSSASASHLTSPAVLNGPSACNEILLILPVVLVVLVISMLYIQYLGSYDGGTSSSHREKKVHLPPGSMGWPYIGETLKLYTENPNSFFSNREEKYGGIFKSHILGCPCVMISSPEAAKLVLVTKSHMFKPTYPVSKMKLIGPQALFFHQGQYHARLRRLVQATFTPAALSSSISHIENIVLHDLLSSTNWQNSSSNVNHDNPVLINTLQEMKKYAFQVAMMSVFGGKRERELEGIKQLYQCLEKGYNSMPLNLPGTSFHSAMKARKKLNERLKMLIAKRREGDEVVGSEGGLLELLLRSNHKLDDSQICDNIVGVIFAAHDTTASVLTWILKYLHDNQDLLQAVTVEQDSIRQLRLSEANRGLTWADTRNMPLTSRIIQETLRRASILSFTFREAVEDVEFQGYLIPKGWKVLPLFRSIHHCAKFFPKPDHFDPSRFEVAPKPNTYMPFGNGAHSCPGSELAKLEMLVFLHHLTTTCRWEVIGDEDEIQYGPFPVPKHGLPIKVYRRAGVHEE